MSKVTLAFGSFALGVAATLFALSSSLTLSSAQGRITPQRPIPPLAVGSGAGIPTVPVITQHYADFGLSATNLAYDVDGSECVRCVFDGPVLRYSGGNFQFTPALPEIRSYSFSLSKVWPLATPLNRRCQTPRY